MMTAPKPTIVLVPGAWHSPSHYSTLLAHLEKAGYPTTSSRLPGVGCLTPLAASVEQDANFIRETMLLPLLDAGKDVFLVLHSYAGMPGSAAAKGLSKAEREEKGLKGGVVGLALIASFVIPDGGSLQQTLGGKLSAWTEVDESSGNCTVPFPIPPFYADVPAAVTAAACAELLPHAVLCFRTPNPPQAWADRVFDGRRAYIFCAEDGAIPLTGQKAMVENSGVEWDVRELQAGHSPQLSMPDKVTELLLGWVQTWTGEDVEVKA